MSDDDYSKRVYSRQAHPPPKPALRSSWASSVQEEKPEHQPNSKSYNFVMAVLVGVGFFAAFMPIFLQFKGCVDSNSHADKIKAEGQTALADQGLKR